jgi:hypothetical protein
MTPSARYSVLTVVDHKAAESLLYGSVSYGFVLMLKGPHPGPLGVLYKLMKTGTLTACRETACLRRCRATLIHPRASPRGHATC